MEAVHDSRGYESTTAITKQWAAVRCALVCKCHKSTRIEHVLPPKALYAKRLCTTKHGPLLYSCGGRGNFHTAPALDASSGLPSSPWSKWTSCRGDYDRQRDLNPNPAVHTQQNRLLLPHSTSPAYLSAALLDLAAWLSPGTLPWSCPCCPSSGWTSLVVRA